MNHSRRMVVIASAAVLFGLVVFYGATRVAKEGKTQVKLAPGTFSVGNAVERSKAIALNGPLLFPDAGGRDLDIFVHHLGTDSSRGWLAFDARRPGQTRSCPLRFLAEQKVFVDVCTGVLVPENGGTLPHYKATVSAKGELVVDFHTPGP
jgi:hypothetical protein